MATDIQWIKITTNMFDDEKIDFISSLPEGDSLIVIWIRLLTMAGKNNANGYIFLTEKIPFTEDMLSHKFKKPINVVKLALETFERLGMIAFDDERRIIITNWCKHQNVDAMERVRELTRLRVAKYREIETADNASCNVTVTLPVTECNAIDSDSDKDSDIDKDNKQQKRKYGEYSNVKLTDKELSRLKKRYGEEKTTAYITFLDEYIEEKGYKSKSHNLSIQRWVADAVDKKQFQQQPKLSKFEEQRLKIKQTVEMIKNASGNGRQDAFPSISQLSKQQY